ncbi:MAG: hypothetical protein J0H74_05010 [Chitinophagaceae bacterium]|nr:hypothetical protein [Chitinophagaceae bacterium]
MLKSAAVLLTSLLSISFCPGQKVAIQPSILDFHLAPGNTVSQVVHISNLSDQQMGFRAYLADWLRDSTGVHQYFRPDTLSHSCAGWVSLDKDFIEVPPGGSRDLVVKLQPPSDLRSFQQMKWAMLFLQSGVEQDSASAHGKDFNTHIRQLLRVGVHIYQTPPTLTHYSARALALKEVPGEKNAYDLYMENTGETMLQCKVHLELTNIETGKEFRSEKVEFPVFPEGTRKVRLMVPVNTPRGRYSALAILDIGEGIPLEAVEKKIEVL